jgi:hypothetical protein
MHSISCGCGLVYIRRTGGSVGNKTKEHHHLDIPAVAVMTSNSRKPVASPGNPDTSLGRPHLSSLHSRGGLFVSKMEASHLYYEGQEVAFCFRHTMWFL